MERKLEKKRNEQEESEYREFESELKNVEETQEIKENDTVMNTKLLQEGGSFSGNSSSMEEVMRICGCLSQLDFHLDKSKKSMSMLGVQHHFLKLPNITESRNSYHKRRGLNYFSNIMN
ncbi:CMF_collapsed_G0013400.mRNA.1.CDS.1 [Saccharomyces cerevisiae]|nr:CMF_collapsed_G0013400.mRNA.1.CDS.1 [Saccharomyces cerevisiae]